MKRKHYDNESAGFNKIYLNILKSVKSEHLGLNLNQFCPTEKVLPKSCIDKLSNPCSKYIYICMYFVKIIETTKWNGRNHNRGFVLQSDEYK